MADTIPTEDQPSTPQPPRKKKRRLWLKLLLVLVLLLLLLIITAPMIASSSTVKGIVLAQVNKHLNGSVAVDKLNLGWFTGTGLSNVKVHDDTRLIASLGSLQTNLTLLDVVFGRFSNLDIVIDGASADIYIDADGKTNLEGIVKESPATPADPSAAPARLPDLSGRVRITNTSATIHRAGEEHPVRAEVHGEVNIPSINEPIRSNLEITMFQGAQVGQVLLDGNVHAVHNNVIDAELLQAKQSVVLRGINLSALAGFLPPDGGIGLIEGIANGKIDLTIDGSREQTVDGTIDIRNFAVGGEALQGDTLRSKEVKFLLPNVRLVQEPGVTEFDQARFLAGTADGTTGIRVSLDQASVTVSADTTIAALTNLSENRAPGSTGFVRLNADARIDQLAAQLTRTLALAEGVTVTGGQYGMLVELKMQPDRSTVSANMDLVDVAGQRDGQTIVLQPVKLAASATSLGGGGELPDLRDIDVTFDAGFANGMVRGANLGVVQAQLKGQLEQLQSQLSQFADLGDIRLAGSFNVNLNTTGNLVDDNGQAQFDLTAVIQNLDVRGLTEGDLREPRIALSASGGLQRGTDVVIRAIDALNARIAIGPETQQTADLYLKAGIQLPADGAVAISSFEVLPSYVRLAELQQTLPPLAKALQEQGLILKDGRVSVAAAGSYINDMLTLRSSQVKLENVAIDQLLPDGKRQVLIEPITATLDSAGTVNLGGDRLHIALSGLSFNDTHNLIVLRKVGTEELRISQSETGIVGSGRFQFGVSLGYVNRILQRLGQAEVAVATQTGDVRSGYASGETVLATTADGGLGVKGNADITNLVIATGSNSQLDPQKIAVTFDTTLSGDFMTINANSVTVDSALIDVDVSQLKLVMSDDPNAQPTDMLHGGVVKVSLPDVAKLMTVVNAFVPPAPPIEGETPLVWTGGAIDLDAEIARPNNATSVTVNVAGKNVAFRSGAASYVAQPFTTRLRAALAADGGSLQVDELDGKFGIATVTAPKPIVIRNLPALSDAQSTAAVSISGDVFATADVAKLMELVNALGGTVEPVTVTGQIEMRQSFATSNDVITSIGDLQIRNFTAISDGATVREELISLVNELAVNTVANRAEVKNFQLAAASSKAIELTLKGTIDDYLAQRNLNLTANLHYDAAKLWQLVKPLLDAETQAMVLEIAGDHQREFKVEGSYPADKEFAEAIKGIKASGGIGLEKLLLSHGLDIQQLDLPFTMENGQLETDFARQVPGQPYVPTAQVNGGVLNLSKLLIDFTAEGIRLTTPENYVLMRRVSMNPALAKNIVGKFVNPLWQNSDQAKGQIEIVIEFCRALNIAQFTAAAAPVASAGGSPAKPDPFEEWRRDPSAVPVTQQQYVDPFGTAAFKLSVTDVQVGGDWVGQLGSLMGDNVFRQNSISGEIKDARIVLQNGELKQDIPLKLDGQHTMRFSGGVNLMNFNLSDMQLQVPMSLFKKLLDSNEKIKPFMPETLTFPVTGSMTKWDLKIDQAVGRAVDDALKKSVTSGLTDLLRPRDDKKKDQPQGGGAAPAPQQQQNR